MLIYIYSTLITVLAAVIYVALRDSRREFEMVREELVLQHRRAVALHNENIALNSLVSQQNDLLDDIVTDVYLNDAGVWEQNDSI